MWIVPVFLIAHRDIPSASASAQLMAPLHSNLVQYSPHQAEEGGVRYWFYFYKTFSRWSPRPRCFLLPQSLPGPAHQLVIAQSALTSHCQPIVQCPRVSCREGSSCDLSPVFRISDTLVLRVGEYSQAKIFPDTCWLQTCQINKIKILLNSEDDSNLPAVTFQDKSADFIEWVASYC